MLIKDKLILTDSQKVKEYHGHAQIDLMRNGKIVHRTEKDNAITAALADFLKAQCLGISGGIGRPFKTTDFFNGCFLLDSTIPFTGDNPPTALPGNVGVVAHAGNVAYSGSITTRGSFNATESSIIDNDGTSNGFKFVWDWNTSQGNGNINSICLTHYKNGYNGIGINEDGLKLPSLINMGYTFSDYIGGRAQILNKDSDVLYVVYYADGKVTVDEIRKSILTYRLNEGEPVGDTHKITTTIGFDMGSAYKGQSVSYSNGYLYCIKPSNSKFEICKINTSNWTGADVTINFATTLSLKLHYPPGFSANKYPVKGNYMYITASNGDVYKLNLNLTSDIVKLDKAYDFTIAEEFGRSYFLSGDDLIAPTSTDCGLWIRDNKVYKAPLISDMTSGNNVQSVLANNINGMFIVGESYNKSNTKIAEVLAPNFISTVNNLENAVTKNSELTMKLTYTISEES